MADPGKVKQFPFRSSTFEIDFNLMTVAMTQKMNKVIGTARAKKSAVIDVPIDIGESESKWASKNREKLLDRNKIRRSDESVEEFAVRVNLSNMESQEYALDVLNGLAPLFGQAPVSEDDFQASNWPKLSEWLWSVFREAGVPAEEYNLKS
jgi:hypothetical protein